jgi:hypothetical protein
MFVTFTYSNEGNQVATSHYFQNGKTVASILNSFGPSIGAYLSVESSTLTMSNEKFINFTLEYTDNDQLDSISIYSPNLDDHHHSFHSLEKVIGEELLKSMMMTNEDEEREEERRSDEQYTSFISYSYENNLIPNQATNVTIQSSSGTTDIFRQFILNTEGKINEVNETTSKGVKRTTRYYYDGTTGLMTKVCQENCLYFVYDSFDRLTQVQINGKLLEEYSYTFNKGVSQIVTADLGPHGKWTFKY